MHWGYYNFAISHRYYLWEVILLTSYAIHFIIDDNRGIRIQLKILNELLISEALDTDTNVTLLTGSNTGGIFPARHVNQHWKCDQLSVLT